MNCPLCGKICRCHSDPSPSASPGSRPEARTTATPRFPPASGPQVASERQLVDAEAPDLSEERFAASLDSAFCQAPADDARLNAVEESGFSEPTETLPAGVSMSGTAESASDTAPDRPAFPEPDGPAWRDEISARLNRYRSRRRLRPPRYPSLHLQFGAVESSEATVSPALPPAFGPISDQALALDGMSAEPFAAESASSPPQNPSTDAAPRAVISYSGHSSAKVLEFPRLGWAPPVPPPDQLAEPVLTRLRILEVPEVTPDPPALGGITMDASVRQESAGQPGINAPLPAGSLPRRAFAAAVDGLFVAVASALFGAIFWKVARVRPPLAQMLLLAAGIPCLFWAAYQYLLIVYAASTPGLRLAGLKLFRFDGAATSRSLRRWRVLASYLSGASLGMGFAWAFLDEDKLCWHDRITHTYLMVGKGAGQEPVPRPPQWCDRSGQTLTASGHLSLSARSQESFFAVPFL